MTPAAVLVVEDDSDIREAIVETLEDAGHRVESVGSGAVALSRLPGLPRPCLIVLDLTMPVMDGFEFLRRLDALQDAREFVVLVTSARVDLEKAKEYAGVVGTLSKPFTQAELLRWVERYCPTDSHREPGPP